MGNKPQKKNKNHQQAFALYGVINRFCGVDETIDLLSKYEDEILQNFCKWLQDTGTEINQTDIDLYYEMRGGNGL